MKKLNKFVTDNLHWLIVAGVAVLCAVFLIFGTVSENGSVTLDGSNAKIEESTKTFIENANQSLIEYAETTIPAVITNEDGTTEVINAPTVESIENNELIEEACEEGEECGLGSYIYAPTDTYTNFKNYTIGKCWNTDGHYGAQCWDLGDLFWQNYAGRNLSTCGTGAAKGIWNCKEQNAGSEFDLIYNASEVKAGDWVIFSGGKYGHIGEAMGNYNNGYIALLGQNQGGSSCSGGGSAANIINMSMKNFLGAFRPKTYETSTPTVGPDEPSGASKDCTIYSVSAGDTLGSIMKYCEGYVDWSKMNDYAKSWTSNVTGTTVYDGWNSVTGVGLHAGATITRK